jgi:2-C-methyl-D-erythritol 4-phosphate cytidylyltransferase
VFALIPAAGSGARMRLQRPKQYAKLRGRALIEHSLHTFLQAGWIDGIVVVLAPGDEDFVKLAVSKHWKLATAPGGATRAESVLSGVRTIMERANSSSGPPFVLVHDAVRPFVDSEIIANVIAGVQKHGAAIAGVPAVDTVKQVDRTADGAVISATIPRERVVLAQTPQGFTFSILKRAFDEAEADGFTGTDEASLVERSGHDVAVVMGSPRNIKITTPADLELAEFFISVENRRRASLTG